MTIMPTPGPPILKLLKSLFEIRTSTVPVSNKKRAKKAVKKAAWRSASLKDACKNKEAPSKSGVYKLYHKGELMKVGKAEDGLRKRFSDYHRGKAGGTAGSDHIDASNRDEVTVVWKTCPPSSCRELEKQLYDEAKSKGESMPWSRRR